MPAEILLTTLAGLGLFFFGIKSVSRNLTAIAGDRFRRHLSRATSTVVGSAFIGVIAGLVTQSGRTTSFILASLVQAGVIPVERAAPVVVWSNLGCALIIFVAVLPIHLVALLMIGVAGASIAFERPRPLLGAAHAVFGLALVLFGLRMMSAAATVLPQLGGFDTAVAYVNHSPWYAFVMGLGLTLLAQSHMAIILITVPIATHGVLGFDQSILLVYGTQFGSSLITYFTGGHFRGEPRRAVAAQIVYNLVGVSLFLLLFVVDHMFIGNGGLMRRLIESASGSAGTQVALVALAFNVVTPVVLTMFSPIYARVCAAMAPARGDEDLGRPSFLWEEMRDNTATALILAEREQLRLLRRLPEYLEYLRQVSRPRTGISPATHHAAFASVDAHIRRFQSQLMSRHMSTEQTEWLINQQQRQEVLGAIEEACHDFCELGLSTDREDLRPVLSTLAEATDTLVLTALSAMASADASELDLLDRITSNKGAAMEVVRRRYLASADHLPPEARAQILSITTLFERAAWSLGRFGHLLRFLPAMSPRL